MRGVVKILKIIVKVIITREIGAATAAGGRDLVPQERPALTAEKAAEIIIGTTIEEKTAVDGIMRPVIGTTEVVIIGITEGRPRREARKEVSREIRTRKGETAKAAAKAGRGRRRIAAARIAGGLSNG
jgi:hypothetical protein